MRFVRTPLLPLAALVLLSGCSGAADPTPATGPAASAHAAEDSPVSDGPSPKPTPVDIRSLTSAELQHQWWSWAGSTPTERNPVVDPDGRHCGEGQHEGIWLLAGTFGGTVTRTCAVPVGTPVLFPVVTMYGKSSDCLTFMNDARGSAVLDGTALSVEELGSTQIRADPMPDSPIRSHRDFNDSWACGLWVRLDELTPGRHEIVLRGSSGTFSTGVDYRLTATEDPTAVSRAQADRTGPPSV
ncbi:hypothetical protein ACWDRR_26400 [Kitasatospora sp. NPDC003701]